MNKMIKIYQKRRILGWFLVFFGQVPLINNSMTIHTPIESPYRVYLKHAVLRIIYFEIRLKK
jgi:hypothetical protein